jgi:hypothetical protein
MFNNSICDVLVSVLASSVVDRRIESRFGQTAGEHLYTNVFVVFPLNTKH